MSAERVLFPPNRLGNEHRVIRGIGLISCVYVNCETGQFWVIDYRLYEERWGWTKQVGSRGSDAQWCGVQQAIAIHNRIDG